MASPELLQELFAADQGVVASVAAQHAAFYAQSVDALARVYWPAIWRVLAELRGTYAALDPFLEPVGGLDAFIGLFPVATTLVTYASFFDGLGAAARTVGDTVRQWQLIEGAVNRYCVLLLPAFATTLEARLTLLAVWPTLAAFVDEVCVLAPDRAAHTVYVSARAKQSPVRQRPANEKPAFVFVPFLPLLAGPKAAGVAHALVQRACVIGYSTVHSLLPITGIAPRSQLRICDDQAWSERRVMYGSDSVLVYFTPGASMVLDDDRFYDLLATLVGEEKRSAAVSRVDRLRRLPNWAGSYFEELFLASLQMPMCLDLDWWVPEEMHTYVHLPPFARYALAPAVKTVSSLLRVNRTGVVHALVPDQYATDATVRVKQRTARFDPEQAGPTRTGPYKPPPRKRPRLHFEAHLADDDVLWNEAMQLAAAAAGGGSTVNEIK
jgi:hypothetical protein